MIPVRAGRPADAAELVRLRREMFRAMHGRDERGVWERAAEEQARAQLAEGRARFAAFVVDGDECREGGEGGEGDGLGPAHLAACAVGRIDERLASPSSPLGRTGFVFNVCTDPRYRGRGYARVVTETLLGWFAEQGVTRVDLHATRDAEHLYRSLGFAEHPVALSLHLPR